MRLAVCLCLAFAASASAQLDERLAPPPPDTLAMTYGTSAAAGLILTEYGLGLGASTRLAVTKDLSVTADFSLGAGRDEREQQFFVGFFGETVTPLKRNYVLLAPLHIGLEQRLFRTSVEDNFRPYVHASIGPTGALQWPYFDDEDGDGVREQGEQRLGATKGLGDAQARIGVGGTLALGAYFGRGRRTVQGLRFGFTGHYFPTEIDLLETAPSVEQPSRHTFWTPVVSFHVARLLD